MDYSKSVEDLFVSQTTEWDLARANYKQLENVKTRSISFNKFELLVQFNPGRITSSAAKVDTKSIEARPCFLCEKNRPEQQQGLPFETGMTILVNPFPIFKKHLTIVADSHTDQRISGNISTMLALARELPEYHIFYNGPQCGASAPDHLHFQAGNKGFLPIEKDFSDGRACSQLRIKTGIEQWQWTGYFRGIITLKSTSDEKLISAFYAFYTRFADAQPERPEPMLNILASYCNGEWIIHIIPRKLHRPSQFFAEGDEKILLSPASVDMGGVIITPREEDFVKISKPDLTDIFSQVTFNDDELLPFIKRIL